MSFLTAASPRLRHTVLVFDSGVGGLSIYNEIQHLLPNLHYIYAFDNVAFPYGNKTEKFIINRIIEVISTIQQRYSLALAVIACNTASTVALPALRKKFQFPVVGVVPAIKTAARLTTNRIIGLLATYRTVKGPYIYELVTQFANKCQVLMLGSAELVELVEAKFCGENLSLEILPGILQPWLCMSEPPDTIVLGCTHFSLFQNELLKVLPEGTKLVDSVTAVAQRAVWLLKNQAPNAKSSDANIAFCASTTKKTEQFFYTLYRYGFKTLENLRLL